MHVLIRRPGKTKCFDLLFEQQKKGAQAMMRVRCREIACFSMLAVAYALADGRPHQQLDLLFGYILSIICSSQLKHPGVVKVIEPVDDTPTQVLRHNSACNQHTHNVQSHETRRACG